MELNAYFKSLVDQDRAAVVICDLEHTIIYMNPAAIASYAKHGGAALLGKSVLTCHNPQSRQTIQRVIDWFAADKNHNLIYTYHNVKQNKDVYMVSAGRRRHPDRLLRKARIPQPGNHEAVRYGVTSHAEN